MALADNTTVTIANAADTLTVSNLQPSAVTLTKEGPGKLTVNNMRTNSLVVNAGAVIVIANGGNSGVSYISSLSVGASAALNLNDNDLVVNNGVFTSIKSLVTSGYSATPDASKTGVTSTTGQNSGGKTILALFDNALVGLTQWPTGSGVSIGASAIVGKYTYFGDATLDGQVTADDYLVLDANRNTAPAPGVAWIKGDMTNDGSVTADDYLVLDANRGLGVGSPLAASGISVPEPGVAAWVLGWGSGVLLARKPKRPPLQRSFRGVFCCD